MRKTLCAIATIALACGGAAMAAEPIIDTVAGGGAQGANGSVGDGGPARSAYIYEPTDVAIDAAGNLYIAEACRIRKVTPAGVITTIGGNGVSSKNPLDGAQATSGSICTKTVAVDRFGYVWYSLGPVVFKIAPNGVVSTVAGNVMTPGYRGDGGPASSAWIIMAADITFDAAGNVYLADYGRVRKIAPNGIITTVAGNGDETGDAGDYGPATAAQLSPRALTIDGFGNLLIVDQFGSSVRKVDATGMISRVFGGWQKFRSDPVAKVIDGMWPQGVATDPNGNVLVSNRSHLLSLVSPSGALEHVIGAISDSAWGGQFGFEGDGGPARLAKMYEPAGMATDAQGNLYIADKINMRVRKVTGAFATPTLPAGAFTLDHATTQRLETPTQSSVGVATGDANGDKRDDLFVLTADRRLYVYRQNTNGTLAAPLSYAAPQVELTDVMAIDLNHDPYTDIVIAGAGGLYVMLGGATTMAPPVAYTGISGANDAFYLQQADMNADGHRDVLALLSDRNTSMHSQAIYYGNGSGVLASKKFAPVTDGSITAIHDMNGDGKPDMVYGWQTWGEDSGVAVAYHDGIDNFLPPTRYAAGAPQRVGNYLTVGDFDNDRQPDVVFSIEDVSHYRLAHWVRTQTGGFAYAREWTTYDIPQTLMAADINRDGLDDLLVAHQGYDAIGYMQQAQKRDGAFWLDRETKSYAKIGGPQAQPHALTVGDFNNDKCPDVAVVSTDSGLQILYRKPCAREKNGGKPRTPPKVKPTGAGYTAPSGATFTESQSSASTTGNTYASIVKLSRKGWASVAALSDSARVVLGFLAFGFTAWFGLAAGAWWLRR